MLSPIYKVFGLYRKMQNLRGGTKDIGRHSVDAKLVLNSRLKRARVEGSPVTVIIYI